MKFAPLRDVHLGVGPFTRAQDLDAQYLLGLDPDRLLAPFRHEAGLPRRAVNYGNWESQGLDGHTAGHYLSAVSLMWASTGRPEFQQRADHIVDGLAECQDARSDGYVGGVPRSSELWAEVARGVINPATFSEGRWVPWYNLHKTFAGLIDAYRHADNRRALDVLKQLADWWLNLARGIDDADFEIMLSTEFGGMNESFADLAEITGDDSYVRMARRFGHRAVLEPLAAGRDELTGLHANTQIPKVLGYHKVALAGGDADARSAAEFFWSTVVDRRSVAIGGNSVREHFHDLGDFGPMVRDREGPESCNTYNMIRLSGLLFENDDIGSRIDFVERALFNHVLSAQHPVHGGFVYFTSHRPGHYRLYSVGDEDFWCCVGTGMEANARHGAMIYGVENSTLAVELFIDSAVEWRAISGRLTQRTAFPHEPRTRLEVEAEGSTRATLALRVPPWLMGAPDVTVNGERFDVTVVSGRVSIDRMWSTGDVVEYELPMADRLERMPDGSTWGAAMHGPIVLAARVDGDVPGGFLADGGRMGHVALGRLLPMADLPMISDHDFELRRLDPDRLRFAMVTDRGSVELIPFSEVHDTRYQLYWPMHGGDTDGRRAELVAEDEWSLGIDARTVDGVALGEQQPEVDHRFRGESSERGRDRTTWRKTSTKMQVELSDWLRIGVMLRVDVIADAGAAYDVTVDGTTIFTVNRSDENSPSEPVSIDLALETRSDDPHLVVAFIAHRGSTTDRITVVRLMSE